MSRLSVRVMGLAAVCAFAMTVRAQERIKVAPKRGLDKPPAARVETPAPEKKAEPAKGAADTEGRFNPFGDPSKFTRFGGWGGIGSSMSQWGMARSMLIMMPAVQEELALTVEQKKALQDWMLEMRERGERMAQELRAQGEAVSRQMNIGAAFEMLGRVNEIFQENEQGIARILTKGQRKRLDQIALQMEGVSALLRPEVAQVVQLNELQAERVQMILLQSKMRQMGYWLQQAMTMRTMRERSRETEKPAGHEGGDDANEPERDASTRTGADRAERSKSDERGARENDEADSEDEDDEAAEQKRRSKRRQEFRKQFDRMRSGADEIQDDTVREVLKVLGPRQRAAFDKLLGPPFDPNKALSGWPPRREGGGGPEGESRPAEAAEREADQGGADR